jgi:ankyrin repeat protein
MTTEDAIAAIKNEDLDALTSALDTGADLNASDGFGRTLLMWSIIWQKLHMVEELLSRGADVHRKTRHGQTALHFASVKGCNNVFLSVFSTACLRAMNFRSLYGWTPLHYLARHGSDEQMAFALSHPGIDTSIRNREGQEVWGDHHRSALQTYRDQEARWQPLRYTWIKLLMIPTRR